MELAYWNSQWRHIWNMKQFNVEVFDNELNYLFNASTSKTKFKEDYLDPEKSKVILNSVEDVKAYYFIRLYRDGEDYAGVVVDSKQRDDGTTEVTYSSVESLFDRELLIDVDEITGTFEEYIKARIDELYVDGPDVVQYLPMEVVTVSQTNDWSFEYDIENEPKEDEEPPERLVAFINILDDLILPAFSKYDIVLNWSFDFTHKLITVTIKKNTAVTINIETKLPNIIDKTVTVRKVKKRINKINIWNSKDFERSTIYYLHSDDSFDTTDDDRVTPVNYQNATVGTDNNQTCIDKKVKALKSDYSTVKSYNGMDPAERTAEDIQEAKDCMNDINSFMNFGWTYNSGDGYIYDANNVKVGQESWPGDDEFITAIEAWAETADAETYGETTALALFTDKAYEKAYSVFSKNKYDNLIELEVALDDEMLKPLQMKIGQVVNVINDGISYTTILSGREIEDTATLIFGTIRLEMTKMLKGRA